MPGWYLAEAERFPEPRDQNAGTYASVLATFRCYDCPAEGLIVNGDQASQRQTRIHDYQLSIDN